VETRASADGTPAVRPLSAAGAPKQRAGMGLDKYEQ